MEGVEASGRGVGGRIDNGAVWFADGIKIIGAGPAAFYVYLVPPFGILGGWLLLGERLGPSLLVSFALIVGGVVLAQSKQKGAEQAS